MTKTLFTPFVDIDFEPLRPVVVVTVLQARKLFGELYKYDLPKWCKKNNFKCFFYPPTMVYIILPTEAKEV